MLKRILLAATAGLLLTSLMTTAANADTTYVPEIDGTATLTVGDVRYTDSHSCLDAPVTVSVEAPDDYAYLGYDFTSTYNGPTTLSDTVQGSSGYSQTFNDTFRICPEYDRPGTYTGTLDVVFYDFDYNVLAYASTTDNFRVIAAATPAAPVRHTSRLYTAKMRTGEHGYTIAASVKYDNRAWAGHRTTLQVRRGGAWRTVKSSWTNAAGRANFAVTPPRGAARSYRVVSDGTAMGDVSRKISRTYRLARR